MLQQIGPDQYQFDPPPVYSRPNPFPARVTIDLRGIGNSEVKAWIYATIEAAVSSAQTSGYNALLLGAMANRHAGQPMRFFDNYDRFINSSTASRDDKGVPFGQYFREYMFINPNISEQPSIPHTFTQIAGITLHEWIAHGAGLGHSSGNPEIPPGQPGAYKENDQDLYVMSFAPALRAFMRGMPEEAVP